MARLEALDFKHATTSTYSPAQRETNSISEGREGRHFHDSIGKITPGSSDQSYEMISHPQVEISKKPSVLLPCIILETNDPSRIFFGQQRILEIMEEALLPTDVDPQPGLKQFALCGLGGMGKTELATEFALRNIDKFEAIFWVRADEPAKLDQCFVDISVKLGLETSEKATNQIVSRSLVKGWLANPVRVSSSIAEDISSTASSANEASWLLIFDNADDPKLLGDYWPEGPGSVLVTSRDPLAKRLFSSSSSGVDLEPLSDADGGALLRTLVGTDEDGEENAKMIAENISASLAGLPLAISQMAGIIRRQELSFSEFQSIYEEDEHRSALYRTKYNSSTKSYKHSIATVWAFEKLSQEAKSLMAIMLFMDPDIVQETVLFEVSTQYQSSQSFSRAKFNEIRAELSRSSLIRRDKMKSVISDYHLSVHRLVQDAIRSSLSDEEMIAVFEVMVNHLWQAWPAAMPPPSKPSLLLYNKVADTRYAPSRYPLCAALYPHVLRLKQLFPLVSSCSDDIKIVFAALLVDAAWYQWEKGKYRGFDGFFELAQSLCEAIPGEDSDIVLSNIHLYLGLVYSDTNELELSHGHRDAFLEMQKTVCASVGPDFLDGRLGLAYAEKALALANTGLMEESLPYFEEEYIIRGNIGKMNQFVSRDANYALALISLGRIELAERILLFALSLFESTGKELTLRSARGFQALGTLRYAQGRFDESYSLHSKSLHHFAESMGIRYYLTADLRYICSLHLIRMQRHKEALDMLNAALECWTLTADIFQPELARATWTKAKVLAELGESLKASLAFKVAARLRAKLVPQDKRDVKALLDEDFDRLLPYRAHLEYRRGEAKAGLRVS